MMPPEYLNQMAQEHLRDLRKFSEPFVTPAWVQFLRTHFAAVLIKVGTTLSTADRPAPPDVSSASTSPQ